MHLNNNLIIDKKYKVTIKLWLEVNFLQLKSITFMHHYLNLTR